MEWAKMYNVMLIGERYEYINHQRPKSFTALSMSM